MIVGDAECFIVDDLDFDDLHQWKLKKILKQRSAVIYSYFNHEKFFEDTDTIGNYPSVRDAGPIYKMAQVKQRLKQNAFRRAVFDHHQPRCLITGCDVQELIEAAHLKGRVWQEGHRQTARRHSSAHRSPSAYDAGLIKLDAKHRLIEINDNRLRGLYERYLAQ